MFAWILKTKAVIFGSVASTSRSSACWARGGGAYCPSAFDQVANAVIAQCRSEKDRRQMPLAKGFEVERATGLDGKCDLLDEGVPILLRQQASGAVGLGDR